MFCKYKNIFGEPRKGVHSLRIYDKAAVDIILTLVASALLSYHLNINIILMTLVLLILGELLHRLFCVK